MNQHNLDSEADTFIPPPMPPDREPLGLVDSKVYGAACGEATYWSREALKYRTIAIVEGVIILMGGVLWILL